VSKPLVRTGWAVSIFMGQLNLKNDIAAVLFCASLFIFFPLRVVPARLQPISPHKYRILWGISFSLRVSPMKEFNQS